MKKKTMIFLLAFAVVIGILSGCGVDSSKNSQDADNTNENKNTDRNTVRITPTEDIEELESGLSVVRYEGNHGFDEFLEQGGADSDMGVAEFLMEQLSDSGLSILFGGNPFGCSTLSVQGIM